MPINFFSITLQEEYWEPISKTIPYLKEKGWDDVSKAFMLYINPGSPVEQGLRRRRTAKGNLWDQGLNSLPKSETPQPLKIIEAITETFLKKEKLDSTQLGPH
jgi:hypothetical protein